MGELVSLCRWAGAWIRSGRSDNRRGRSAAHLQPFIMLIVIGGGN